MTEIAGPVYWGYPSMIHFFLIGVGGGTLAISSLLCLLYGRRNIFFSVARYAAFIAPISVLDDAIVLIVELGHPDRFLNIFRHINFLSPMWIGAWLIFLFLVVSPVYAYTYLALPDREGLIRRTMKRLGVPERVGPGDRWTLLRRTMAFVGLPLGIAICHYPGFMLSGLAGRPFWNTALLPILFFLSGITSALSAIMFCRVLFKRVSGPVTEKEYRDDNYWLALTSVLVLGAQGFTGVQVIYAHDTTGTIRHAHQEMIFGGGLMYEEFWLGAVGAGLVVPIVTGLILILPRLVYAKRYAYPRALEAIMPASVLFGAFMFNYVLLFGGQLTGPIGL